jgi:hypothetical protein
MIRKSFLTFATACAFLLLSDPTPAFGAGPETRHYRDSLYMDVLRHGKVEVGYLFYFPGAVSVAEGISHSPSLLYRLDAFFGATLKDSLVRFSSAELTGGASIEGSAELNEKISMQRAYSLRNFLESRYKLSSYFPVVTDWVGEDWKGLTECVREATLRELPQRDKILQIIRNVPVEKGREGILMRLDGGIPYQYMKLHYFERQRKAVITLTCDMRPVAEKIAGRKLTDGEAEKAVAEALLPQPVATRFVADPAIKRRPVDIPPGAFDSKLRLVLESMRKPLKELTEAPVTPDTERMEQTVVVIESDTITPNQSPAESAPAPFRPHWVIKTNLVADAGITPEVKYRTPMPNLEIEYLFNRRFSAAVSGLYEGWGYAEGYARWRVTAYTLEGRYRLLPDHHYGGLFVGVYGRVGDYNRLNTFDEGDNNHTGKYWGAGLSLGYTLPFSRHWILEGGASGGYRHIGDKFYSHLRPDTNYFDFKSSDKHIGLTDLFLRFGYRF